MKVAAVFLGVVTWATAASAFLPPPSLIATTPSRTITFGRRRGGVEVHEGDHPAPVVDTRRFNPLRALSKRGLQKRVFSVAAVVILSRGSVAHAASKKTIQVDCSDETAYAPPKNTKKNQKVSNLVFVATVPLFIKNTIDRSKARKEREQVGVFFVSSAAPSSLCCARTPTDSPPRARFSRIHPLHCADSSEDRH